VSKSKPWGASSDVVVIAEQNMTGHRPYYVRLLAEEALRLGRHVVIITSPSGLDSDDARIHLGHLSDRVSAINTRAWSAERLATLSNSVGARVTVVPDGDRFAIKLAFGRGWRGQSRLSILIMREVAQPTRWPFVQQFKTKIRRVLFRHVNAFRNVQVVILKSQWWSGISKFTIARDPVTLNSSPCDVERITHEWKLTEDRYWFAILGAISARKNVDLVARALAGSQPRRVGLLVAGAWDDGIGQETVSAFDDLTEAGGQVVIVNRRLDDVELDSAVARADCVVVAHSNEGPSGLLGKAAAAGTRVVAGGAKSLRDDLIRIPHIGEWCPLDEMLLAGALGRALGLPRPGIADHQGVEAFARALLDVTDGDSEGVFE
jgi:glycosyltransferase involved in cell wall biosynthesis